MSISGNLKTMAPSDLLQWLSLARKTGTLIVRSGATEKRIFFQEGRIISSASNDPREHLGQFLMSHGFLSEAELKKAMEVQQQSKILIGKILVMINVIEQEDLIRLMRLKAEEGIYEVFLWQEGDFRFIDDELPSMEMVPLQIDVAGIIMEGSRRIDEWSRIREVIPDSLAVPVIERPVDLSLLSEAERTIVRAINAQRTIGEIVLESRSSPFTVSKTVYELMKDGSVRLEQKVEPERTPADHFIEADGEVAALVARAQLALQRSEYEKALRLLKAAQNLEPDNARVRAALRGAETLIVSELKKEGIAESKVPKVAKSFEEISTMNFSPNEGFILSRINGVWNIDSIIKISPMRHGDALLIFHKLYRDGVIELT